MNALPSKKKKRPSSKPFDVEISSSGAAAASDTSSDSIHIYAVDGPNEVANYSRKLGVNKDSNVGSQIVFKNATATATKGGGDGKRAMIVSMDSASSPQSSVKRAAMDVARVVASSSLKITVDLAGVANARTQKRFLFYLMRWMTTLRVPERLSGRTLLVASFRGDEPECRAARKTLLSTHHAAAYMNLPTNAAPTPADMARMLSEFASAVVTTKKKSESDFKSHVLDARELKAQGLGLVLAVGSASSESAPACLLVLEAGAPAARAKRTVLLAGKGIMYDTGGLAIKPQRHMYGMHGDKTGAVVAVTVLALCAEEAAANGVRIVAVAPLTENAIGSRAVRPGDVVKSHDGRGVEIVDPDAEGRLVLADALSYGIRTYKPDLALDFATMTVTGELYHPSLTAAVFTTDNALYDHVFRVGNEVGELVWRVPSWTEDTNEIIASQATGADVRNSGWDDYSDGYSAALFLNSFVERAFAYSAAASSSSKKLMKKTQPSWMHFDVSGTAMSKGPGVPFYGAGICLGETVVKDWMRR